MAILPRLVAVLLLQRGSWITLDRAAHDQGGGNGSSQLESLTWASGRECHATEPVE